MPPSPRRRTIRARLIALTVVPTTALLVLWTFAASIFVDDMLDLQASASFVEEVGEPLLVMVSAVQLERRYAMQRIGEQHATADTRPLPELEGSEQQADDAIAAFRTTLRGVDLSRFSTGIEDRVAEFDAAIDEVVTSRDALREPHIDRREAMRPYDNAVEAGLRVWDAHTELSGPALDHPAQPLESMLRAREALAQQHALQVYGAAAGGFNQADHSDFAAAVGAQQHLYRHYRPDLVGEEHDVDTTMRDMEAFSTLTALQRQVVTAGASDDGIAIGHDPWIQSHAVVDTMYREIEESRIAGMTQDSRDEAGSLLVRVVLGSIVTLVLVVGCALFSARTARDVNRRLRHLRESTLDHARRRLPSVVGRLRAGEEVDVAAEAPELPVGRRDEVGQVVDAFNVAQRTAVESAVEEARLREGVRSVFRNIARRTQSLVHRQLGLLDELEQSETEPRALESLFRIDHLSTQLRRNADNLILLSGQRPDRRQREPVPLQDVVRAASSEIQDYTRVNVLPMPEVTLDGHAAGDLIHLLSELLDNAAAFSPPTAPVTLRGSALANGYAVEVEDRGLGMTDAEYKQLNEVLATAPDFDVARMHDDSRLGIFVVSNIARRLGIQVTLRSSPYNGTQAIVVLPARLVVDAESAPTPRRTVGDEGDGAAAAPRHARPAAPPLPEPERGEAEPAVAVADPPAPDTAPDESDTYKGLPRRRRKRVEAAESEPAPQESPQTPQRSLEEIQRMMSSFQQGTLRGRMPDPSDSTDPRNS